MSSAPGSSRFDHDSQLERALETAETALEGKSTGTRMTEGIDGKIGVGGAARSSSATAPKRPRPTCTATCRWSTAS